MGYDVEWRVINASDYGMPQQRRRVFIMAYRRATQSNYYRNGKPNFGPKSRTRNSMIKWLIGPKIDAVEKSGIGPFADAFPVKGNLLEKKQLFPKIESFEWNTKTSPFLDADMYGKTTEEAKGGCGHLNPNQ